MCNDVEGGLGSSHGFSVISEVLAVACHIMFVLLKLDTNYIL